MASAVSVLLWTLCIGFWIGYGFRVWGERRARAICEQQDAEARNIRNNMVSQARSIDLLLKCSGPGHIVERHATLTVDGKRYDVTIEGHS